MANETQRLWDLLTNRLTDARSSNLDELDFDLDGRLGSPAGASLAADLATIDTAVDVIKAVTDNLPDSGALNDLASILGLVDTAEAAGPYSYTDAGGEQDVYEDTATTRRRISLCFSNRNMTQVGTFRIYRKVDNSNYDLWIEQPVTVGIGDERAWDKELVTSLPWKITYEEGADEGAARDIPYEVITQVKE